MAWASTQSSKPAARLISSAFETGVEDSWGRDIYQNGFDQAAEGKWKNQYLDDED